MKIKLFACIFLVLSMAVLVAEESPSSVPASNEDDILKIGVAGAHSGPLANLEGGAPSLAILADRGGYGTNTALVVRDLADTRVIPVVLFEGVDQGVPNCLELVEQVRESGADIVVWSGYHQEGAQIVMQMRQLGMEHLFIAGDGVYDKNFIQAAGDYAEGVLAAGPKEVSSNPLAVEAAAESKESALKIARRCSRFLLRVVR